MNCHLISTGTYAHTHTQNKYCNVRKSGWGMRVGEGAGEGYDLALRQQASSSEPPGAIDHFPASFPHLPELDQLVRAHLIQHLKSGWLRCFYFNNRNELNKQSQLSKKCIKFNHMELLRLQAKIIRFHLIPTSAPTAKAAILKFGYGRRTGEL